MKIAIDVSPCEINPAGIGQYTLGLITALLEQDPLNQYILFSTKPFTVSGHQSIVVEYPKSGPFKGIRWMRKVSAQARLMECGLMISPSNHIFTIFFSKTIQFIHDLAPLHYPKFFGYISSLKYRLTTWLALRKAWRVVCVSEAVKTELVNYANGNSENIAVVYPGINSWILNSASQTQSKLNSLPVKYLLTLSTLEPRKNHINMLRAFAIFSKTHPDYKFIIVGKKGWLFEPIFAECKRLKLEDKTIFWGYAENEILGDLYRNAEVFLQMSYYEGFGIPGIEALCFNTKLVASDIAVFREAYADLARYANPDKPEDIAEEITLALEKSAPVSNHFIINKFSWKNSASVLQKLIQGG